MSILAGIALAKHRFVDFDGTYPSANAKPLGVTQIQADLDEQATVDLSGSLLVEAGGAISQGAAVATDASGKALTHSSGVIAGYAIDAAAADGDIIRVLV
jgi:hypothetical protein